MEGEFPEWLSWAYWTPERSETFRNFSLAIAGIVSLIFLIWRAVSTDRSARAALRQADIASKQLEHVARQSEIAIRQAEAAARQSEAAAKQATIASDRQVTDVLGRAVDQLGSENALVRTASIHVLGRIGRDSPKDHGAITTILSAYIQEHAKRPIGDVPTDFEDEHKLNFSTETKAMRASINYWIRARITKEMLETAGQYTPEFEVAMMERLDLVDEQTPIWIKALHVEAIKSDVQAALTELGTRERKHEPSATYVGLEKTILQGASLSGCDFSQTVFSRSVLRGASGFGTNFRDCIAVGTDFSGAMLIGAKFDRSNLTGSNYRGAVLKDARFIDADISGADFTDALDLTQHQLDEAHGNEHTLLPEGLVLTLR